MKRFLFLMVLFCMGILSGFAQSFTYTDDNGVIWEGYIEFSYNYEDSTQTLEASINSTTNNSEEKVVVPGEIS